MGSGARAKLVANPRLHAYVQDRLGGKVATPDGTVIDGPEPPRFTGGNGKPHGKHRAWTLAWSPEQISNRPRIDFPDDESMRLSHEAIYQSLSIEGRGALKRELVWCLRTGRALRAPPPAVAPQCLGACHPGDADQRAPGRG